MPATLFTSNAPAPHPAVLIAPGFQMDRTQYESYARHLASWGVVAVLVDYADRSIFASHAELAADLHAALDWMHANTALAIDPARTATAGHSLGGKLAVFAASLDARVKAVIAWDPVDSTNPSVVPEKMVGMSAAVAVVGELTNASGGGMPCAPAAENFEKFYAAAGTSALRITVANADHMDWVDDPSCGFCGFCTAGTASNEVARTVSRRVDVAWLRRQLDGDLTMDAWLDSPPELATGAVAVARK